MTAKASIVQDRVLRVMRPLVRLLVRNGVPYQAFATALKRVFVDAARAELASRSMAETDSAVTLLSGVHRRDVRNLGRRTSVTKLAQRQTTSIPSEVVARWLSDPMFVDAAGAPRRLERSSDGAEGSFDALVAGVSRDVRPRAVLDELLRLGVASEEGDFVRLRRSGFAPSEDFEQMSSLVADNLADHAAAAVSNLEDKSNFLEQAIFVDHISDSSAAQLHTVSVEVWKHALKKVMAEAQRRFDEDSAKEREETARHRARFGVYFYRELEGDE